MAQPNLFGESLALDASARATLPGQFVELPDGTVHYEIAGPPDGEVVVLIHGFSVPYYIWDHNFGALAEAGFRVLRYDLYGRGYSDRPKATYNQDLFDRQLVGLLDALGFEGPVSLVGVSMGGQIAVTFADRHPERVAKLGLIDPSGFPIKVSLNAMLLFIPGLGEMLMALSGGNVLLSGLARDFREPEKFPEYVNQYRSQMGYKGFRRAILSTMRNMPMTNVADTYERVGKQDRPVLLIWGREDLVIPFETHERVKQAVPHLEFHAIDEAGHVPQYERSEAVNPILVDFLQRGP